MPTRITGMTSGMDVESMVKNLMKPTDMKLEKLYKQRTTLTWKQEGFRDLTKQMNTFQGKYMSFTNPSTNLRSAGYFALKNFSIKNADGTDSTGITAKNQGSTKNIEHTIAVSQLATKEKKISNENTFGKMTLHGDEINFDDLKEGASLTLDLDGKSIKATLSQADIDYINAGSDKKDRLAGKLQEAFDAFGKESDGTTKKVNIALDSDGTGLQFSTNAGRALTVKGFSNGGSATKQVAYDPTNIADSLSFNVNGTNIGVNTKNVSEFDYPPSGTMPDQFTFNIGGKNINVSTKDGGGTALSKDAFKDAFNSALTSNGIAASDLSVSVNGAGKISFDAGATYTGSIKEKIADGFTGLTDGSRFDVAAAKPAHVSASTLADRFNDQVAKLPGDPPAFKLADFRMTASAGNVQFEALSSTQKFNVTETTAGSPKLTGATPTPFEISSKAASALGVSSGTSTANDSSRTVGNEIGTNLDEMYIETAEGEKYYFNTTDPTKKSLEITANMSVAEMMNKINGKAELGVTMSHSPVSGLYSLESKKEGEDNAFKTSAALDTAFGFAGNAKNVSAVNALFTLDGADTSRESNTFTIDDMEITINKNALPVGATPPTPITIKSSNDTDKIMEGIKTFINSYNEILGNLNKAYTEPRARNSNYTYYEPLTDEEKGAMKDSDITNWEKKAKQGLMARDDSIGKVIDQMRESMSQGVDLGDGKKISLYDIGIATTDWKDMGVLTIDETKLKKALEERPEDVSKLFNKSSDETYQTGNRAKRQKESGIAERLNDVVQDATRTSPIKGIVGYFISKAGKENTSYTSENDMSRSLKQLNEKIYSIQENSLVKEDSYYRMFAQMEKAMSQAQKQQTSL